jgi:hypothetical protein
MRNVTWKDIVEVVGIAAIVASLVFVGLQMRQAQSIAIADSYQQQAVATLAKSELATMHSELVAKANRGESLSDAETFALSEYVVARWQNAYFTMRRASYLERPTNGPVRNFSSFLCNNPGPREFWENQADSLVATSRGSPLESFANDIDSNLDNRCGQ